MTNYYIEWRIELEADSPEAAARAALKIQRDPFSCSTVFHVFEADNGESIVVDLEESSEGLDLCN